jgi:ELWxxDGT repeat protein
METNPTITSSPLVPINLTAAASKLRASQLINVDGTVYFQGYDPSTTWGLYKLEASGQPLLLGNPATYGTLGLSTITNTKGIVYFVGYDGTKQGLYRVDPGSGSPVRLGDMLISTGNSGPSGNIVNIGGSDYFLANSGNKQLWKIDRVSGALTQVTPTGLPANFSFDIDEPNTGNNFRAANNNLAIGGNLYFRGNGQVWKFDPITNNATAIEIPGKATYLPGELHQLGDTLFFKTNKSSPGQELYKVDPISGSAVLVSDPKFASNNYVIDDNNFIDVNGTLHFVANYGNEIWKLDSTGKAVLAGTVSGAGRTNEATEFTNVNGTVYFNFDDGTNKAQIWKLKSDGTTDAITTIAPNTTYGTTFVSGLKGIGNKLYFSANDAQYGKELRELDSTTDSLTTLDLSPGLLISSPASSSLDSQIIDVNGTPYFSSSVKPDDVSYSQNRIYKLAPAGTVVPTQTPTPTPVVTNPTTPVLDPVTPETPVIPATINFSGQLKTATGDGGLDVSVDKTGSFRGANYDPVGAQTANRTTFESDVAFRIGETGARKFISDIATNATTTATADPNITTSTFGVSGLLFELSQAVSDLTKNGTRTGSGLTQTYQITNPTNAAINFELVRYFDGDLGFDGSIQDRGGRIVRNNRDILFETDSGDNPSAPTTFVGITANGGNPLTANRFEIGQYSSLENRILAGDPLSGVILGDTNGDSFIDTAPYDVTPAFRNVFTLAAGATTTYVTETLFGTGLPSQVVLPETISVVATDANAFEDTADGATFTLTRVNGNAKKSIEVNYTLTGKATSDVDYKKVTGKVTFAAGQETATVLIEPIADTIIEGIESVVLTIDSGTGYNLSDRSRQARVTIADDSSVAELPTTVSIDSVGFTEGNKVKKDAVFNVTLNKPSEVEVTVDVASADGTADPKSDYTALDKTTVYFAPGETTKQITVSITGDRITEPDETFKVNLTDSTNAVLGTDSSVTATIVNDDIPLSIAISDADAAETKPGETPNSGKFVIKRSGDLSKSLTAKYTLSGTTTNSDDYQTVTGTSIFAAGIDTASVDIIPIDDPIYEGNDSITLSVSTEDYLVTGANSLTLSIADNDPSEPTLIEPAKNILSIQGGTAQTLLKFSKSQQGSDRSEVFAFVVDDDLGRINGIKPGESGYLAAAIGRAESIFSSLGNSDFDKRNDGTSERYLNITPGKKVEFLEIIDDTLDAVKSDLLAGKSTANVVFSIAEANADKANLVKFTATPSENSYEIGFKDLVLKVETLDKVGIPIGTGLQGKSEGQVIDLRTQNGIIFDTKTIGDAGYSNYIALYEVEDEKGTLANGLKPGDAGYAEAAIRSAVLRTRFTSQADTSLSVAGGKILAPVVVANGTFENFLNQNPENKADGGIHAYFNFIGANTDNVDHFRLLGDNKFGVEDIYGGGDRDFNDLVFQMKIKG